MKYKLINQTDKKFCNEIVKIYKSSFPINERIEFNNFFKNGYELYAYFDKEEVVGFIACQKNQLYNFICYFAVDNNKRNLGYGSAILNSFINSNKGKCIVLNIENIYNNCPQNYNRIKRLNFYLKNGFLRSDLIFDWRDDILNTLYIGSFNKKTYIDFLLEKFPDCKNFRKLKDEFVLVDIFNCEVDQFYALLKENFCFKERRSKNNYKNLLNNSSKFKSKYIFLENKIVGYINLWEFENFVFIEHFVILKEFRNKGYGTKFFTQFKDVVGKDIIFEVEPPVDDISIGRVNFYLKQGFKFFDIEYYQPSYHKNIISNLKLKIMYLAKENTKNLNEYLETIKHDVYMIK